MEKVLLGCLLRFPRNTAPVVMCVMCFFDVPVTCGKKRLWQKKQYDFACLTSKEVSDLGCVLAMKAFSEGNSL